jgi:proteic killer suppression protein
MISGFRDKWLKDFFVDDLRSKKVPADIEERLFRDLRVPPSNHFEKLRGSMDGFYSIRVNRRWRLVFRWDAATGEASELYLDDHSY